jgi:hypothetical protein
MRPFARCPPGISKENVLVSAFVFDLLEPVTASNVLVSMEVVSEESADREEKEAARAEKSICAE